MKAPKGAVLASERTAIEQLEWYLKMRKYWTEHNQSVTIYVRDEEWMRVGAWVYDHFDELVGVAFLPYENHKYEQAPFEEITKEQYDKMVEEFPEIDYTQLSRYELEDGTMGAKELACVGGACEIT
jgi:ribonucleoside-diphosphate reductase alpha chain